MGRLSDCSACGVMLSCHSLFVRPLRDGAMSSSPSESLHFQRLWMYQDVHVCISCCLFGQEVMAGMSG